MSHLDDVLACLAEGNARYASGAAAAPDWVAQRELTHHHQKPFAAVLSCVDSRVPVERIFDCGLGDVVVARTTGHVADEAVMHSLAFAVETLGISAIVVLGHTNCGAVAVSVAEPTTNAGAAWLASRIRPSVVGVALEGPHAAEIAHARATAASISEAEPMRTAVESGDLVVRPALYDLRSGVVTFL